MTQASMTIAFNDFKQSKIYQMPENICVKLCQKLSLF